MREGALEVIQREDGEERVIRAIGPGEFFGELAFKNQQSRTATVVARSHAKLYAMSREAFQKIEAGSPEFRRRLEQMAASYTRRGARNESSPAHVVDYTAPARSRRTKRKHDWPIRSRAGGGSSRRIRLSDSMTKPIAVLPVSR